MPNKKPTKVRTRFAPSPTGDPHIGSIWTALFNWLYAKHHHGNFILRIEDTDQTRLRPGAENKIIEALRWFQINYDEGPDIGGPYGPYRQSERLILYKDYADRLVTSEDAYYCFCAPERLQKLRLEQEKTKKPVGYDGHCRSLNAQESFKRVQSGELSIIRLKIPKIGETTVNDLIRGRVHFKNAVIDDQVLLKSDGWPTYHLASVVDDHLMNIDPVIRAEEWLPSTPKQLIMYKALGWTPPRFAHLPLILGRDRSKLSKRHGSTDILKFRDDGYLPGAIINYLALLGWNPKTSKEFFTREELIDKFDLNTVNKSGAIFDNQKLDWFNAHYLKSLPTLEIIRLAKPYLEQVGAKNLTDNQLEQISLLVAERAKKFSEVPDIVGFLFRQPDYEAKLLNWKTTNPAVTLQKLKRLIKLLESCPESDFSETNLEDIIKTVINEEKLGVGETLWPLRVALTGLKESPGPFITASILGKTKTLSRITQAIKKLS
ncbi:glutamate--tRNA ligase [Candidatus Uhrbacteria bacterium RIFCSPLOWO2_12_FULL_46_10]|uniref:Glutamate--tRNA ligase n=1 Tax=Candidatus Uhrbacteria bacterium RIFCSPLOWO2_01_FULL_47_25 TaxID=1802402 RepID=A0A1F7UXL3_9BACT|nr:MAG: Glutamate-tRNA ligase [Parcubacteria group bacterium GW2011_GWA2_46_9]OGL60702.1 MAG: glutamate--tRNA ligase [Candidatus Uhrbacteria bacterium RIFCSPHIGHO2_01_FULL_46_23]OGL70333.1 MAG: glutamate--tRNA ligase [Candidatus Uhrbacteria bacterium RIFCSPHIGHO2_02_FULL_47_29]OGL83020.1 MAG: glutamate--tRNA ligase [Candidatus Uhrbacteria bacterium RIFCSPLOWO2_01_FULL_47_25]OGL84466.1 MAG: glutamate--tRNA ligase [Candidatus Uhrbacteria bacterium RIFCSPLOWO2_02_FULL_46_19]OGL90632.1 MAG: glutam